MLYKLQLTIFITILIFIACGIISTYLFYQTAKYSAGRKVKLPFYIFIPILTILGPFGLFAALGMYCFRETLGKCVDGDCFNGHGIKIYHSGDKYIGHWKRGKRSGMGTYYHSDGSIHHGQWKDGDCLNSWRKL